MTTPNALAKAHMDTIPLARGPGEPDPMLIRYDGAMRNGEEKVYAVLAARDLARLPDALIEDLSLLSRDDQDRLVGNREAFFRDRPEGPALYVDTDTHPFFVDRVAEAAGARGVSVYNAIGDIAHMLDTHGDISPPGRPAFAENGFPPLAVSAALREITRIRLSAPEAGKDDTLSP